MTGSEPVWRVRLICCDRDDGDIFRDTWEEADDLLSRAEPDRALFIAGEHVAGEFVHVYRRAAELPE